MTLVKDRIVVNGITGKLLVYRDAEDLPLNRLHNVRSSHPEVFCIEVVLTNFFSFFNLLNLLISRISDIDIDTMQFIDINTILISDVPLKV